MRALESGWPESGEPERSVGPPRRWARPVLSGNPWRSASSPQSIGRRRQPRGAGDGGDGIGLRLAYDAHLFTEATAARLLDHLAALLAAALAAPERPLAELPLLSPAERRQLLAWSDGGKAGETVQNGQAGDEPPLAHHAFLAQAARTPGAPAVVAEGREVSYGELARLARSLARRLVARGIGPESRVAIALERSPRMVAAVLAVLAAGGAYVPLDPASPVERLAVILRDIGRGAVASALLTGGGGGGRAAAREAASSPACPSSTSTRSGRPSRTSQHRGSRRATRRSGPAARASPTSSTPRARPARPRG